MSTIKLDLSKFKHVKSDANSTTLQHVKDGHTITLAHKALPESTQAQLSALSKMASQSRTSLQADEAKHQAKAMANGGDVNEEDPNLKNEIRRSSTNPNELLLKPIHTKEQTEALPVNPSEFEGPDYRKKEADGGQISATSAASGVAQAQGKALAGNAPAYGNTIIREDMPSSSGYGKVRMQEGKNPSPAGVHFGGGGGPQGDKAADKLAKGGEIEAPEGYTGRKHYFEDTGAPEGIIHQQEPHDPGLYKMSPEEHEAILAKTQTRRSSDHEAPEGLSHDHNHKANLQKKDKHLKVEAAEGGEIHCEACGGPIHRKMYANEPDLVSQDDSAPQSIGQPVLPNQSQLLPQPELSDLDKSIIARGNQVKQEQELAGLPPVPKDYETSLPANRAPTSVNEQGIPSSLDPNAKMQVAQGPVKPNLNITLPPSQAPAKTAPSSEEAQGQRPDMVGSLYSPLMQGIEGGYGQTIQGIQQEAREKGAMAQESIAARQEAADNWQNQLSEYEDRKAQVQGHIDTVEHEMRTGQIDPHAFWNKLGTSGKVTASIALFLGGLGSAFTKTPNMAQQIIDGAIDRQLKADTINMNKQSNLLGHYYREMGDLRSAQQQARLDYLTAAQLEIERIAASHGTGIAQAEAQKMIGPIQIEKAKAVNQLAMGLQLSKAMTSGGAYPADQIEQITSMVDDKKLKQIVKMPDGTARFARSPEDATEVNKKVAEYKPISDTLDQLDRLGPRATVTGTPEHAKAISLVNQMIPSVMRFEGINRMSEEDARITKEQFKDPTSFIQLWGGGKAKSDALRDVMSKTLRSNYQQYLMGGYQGGSPAAGSTGLKTFQRSK